MEKRFSPLKVLLLLVVFIIGGVIVKAQTCPNGMISYWKMQEIAGPTYMDSYSVHDAFAPSSAPNVTQGISGNAQLFNQVGLTSITVSDHENFDWGGNSSFSIELWIKFSGGAASNQVFIGRDESSSMMQWWIGSTVTGKISWYLGSSDGSNGLVTTDASFNNGSWHHVVAVRDGTYSKNYLYVDGVLQNIGGTTVNLTGTLSSSSPITIGNLVYGGTPDYYYTGTIDEMAIYNRALEADVDIIPHYNNLRLYQIGYCDGDDPLIFSTPVVEATVGQLYTYNVDASGNSLPTYSLIEGPASMSINATNGEITWTPTSVSQNGHVIIRATNDKGFVEQEFNIYIADVPNCRSNLIAYWDFNESSVPPFSDNISNFKLTGIGPVSVQGLSGKGLLFDGVNDSLNMHDTFSPDKVFFDFDDVPNFSIEVWVKSTASMAKPMVLVGRDVPELSTQYWVGINPDGTVGFYLREWPLVDPEEGYLEGGSVLDGNWHHIVASYSNSANSMRLHVDRIMVDNASKSFWNFGGQTDLNVGMMNTSIDKFWFEGIMDELAFYNTQLDDARILENYNAGIAGTGACVYNHAPVIVSTPDLEVEQGSSYDYELVASEMDPGDVLTLSAVDIPGWLTFTFVPGDTTATLTGTPENPDVGPNSITLRVTDGSIVVDQQFTIEVSNVNDDPVITSVPTLEVDQGSNYSYTVEATDPDGDDLTYSAPQKPASFTFDADTHVLSGVPTNDDVGVIDITVRVFDGTVNVDQEFQITVNDINDAPVFTSIPILEIFQEENYNYTVVANDPDGDDLTYSAVQIPSWMAFDENSHILTGMTPDFEGVVDIILQVTDGEFVVNQEFQVTVKNVNDLPVITSDPATEVRAGAAYLYQIDATDEDGDDLTFTAEDLPAWLSFIPASNSAILSGTPTMDNVGSHTVILKVSDGIGNVIQAFSINVLDPTGIDSRSMFIESVYPIPASDVVYFTFSELGDYTLDLYDITGSVLKQIVAKNTDQLQVVISELPANLYFYKVSVNDKHSVGKLVKQ